MPNKHLIAISYIGATDTRESRVRLYSERFNESVSIPYDHSLNDTYDIAEAWLAAQGFTIFCSGELKGGYFMAVNEFIGLKEAKANKQAAAKWRATR